MNLITSLGVLGSFSVVVFFSVVASLGVMASSSGQLLESALGLLQADAAKSDSSVRFEEWPASYGVRCASIFSRWNKGPQQQSRISKSDYREHTFRPK